MSVAATLWALRKAGRGLFRCRGTHYLEIMLSVGDISAQASEVVALVLDHGKLRSPDIISHFTPGKSEPQHISIIRD